MLACATAIEDIWAAADAAAELQPDRDEGGGDEELASDDEDEWGGTRSSGA